MTFCAVTLTAILLNSHVTFLKSEWFFYMIILIKQLTSFYHYYKTHHHYKM